MITDGFIYFSLILLLAASLVLLEKKTKWKFFKFVPAVVLLYLLAMILCTCHVWDLAATKATYSGLKNNILFAMVFLMLLRCDIRKVIKLGGKMISGFLVASVTIMIGFLVTYLLMKGFLGAESWRPLSALCGSWIGGSGNMIAVQAVFDIKETEMAYALVVDAINYSVWVMFLLWFINFRTQFNSFTKADTKTLDEVGRRLEKEEQKEDKTITFQGLLLLLALGLFVSAVAQPFGTWMNGMLSFFDTSTWTVIFVTIVGLGLAITPVGKIAGIAELSNIALYMVIGLLASRANLLEVMDAPIWILAGGMILVIHGVLLLLIAKLFHFDIFTCGVASLANIGGTASAPILA